MKGEFNISYYCFIFLNYYSSLVSWLKRKRKNKEKRKKREEIRGKQKEKERKDRFYFICLIIT